MGGAVALVKVALGGLWCRLTKEEQPGTCSEEQRIRFDREYDAIIAEMAASAAAVSASRRTAGSGL